MDKPDMASGADLQHSHRAVPGQDRVFRTGEEAAAATVAQLWKGEGCVRQDGDGVKLTNLLAFTAIGALVGVNLRDLDLDLKIPLNIRLEEEVGVGFFHVTVQKLHRLIQGHRQVGGDGGLAGATLAAGYGDNHSFRHPLTSGQSLTALGAVY